MIISIVVILVISLLLIAWRWCEDAWLREESRQHDLCWDIAKDPKAKDFSRESRAILALVDQIKATYPAKPSELSYGYDEKTKETIVACQSFTLEYRGAGDETSKEYYLSVKRSRHSLKDALLKTLKDAQRCKGIHTLLADRNGVCPGIYS